MIPILYLYSDTDAPLLSGTRGSLINLLKKCLVTGYGSKPPAGWTMEFANVGETIAAFRNNPVTGNGVFLQIDEEAPVANWALPYGWEHMTDLNTGFGPFYLNASSLPIGFPEIRKSNVASTAARMWMVLATDKLFYIYVWSCVPNTDTTVGYKVSPQDSRGLVFGDFTKNYPDDSYNSILALGWTSPATTTSSRNGFIAPNKQHAYSYSDWQYLPRNIEGTPGVPIRVGLFSPVLTVDTSIVTYQHVSRGIPYAGQLIVSDVLVVGNTVGVPTVETDTLLRGKLPGIKALGHGYNNFSHLQIVDTGDIEYLIATVEAYYNVSRFYIGSMCFDLTSDWD